MSVRVKSGHLHYLAIRLVAAFVILCGAGAAAAMQDDKNQSAEVSAEEETADLKQEIEELGQTLRAAYMAGTLTGKEAREIYGVMVRSIKAEWEASRAGNAANAKEAAKKPEEESPKRSVLKLSAPKPWQISVLFQPEFLTRDLAILRDELDLDRDQMMIAGVLFRDYLEAIDLASSPLREAFGRYNRATKDRWLAAALQRTDQRLGGALQRAQRVDPDVAVERMKRTLGRIAEQHAERIEAADEVDRARFRAWARRMVEVTGELDDRLASIRERVSGELAELEREDATITADDLVRMAKQLRTEREQLRRTMIESLAAIATEEQRGEENADFTAVMARIRIDHLLPQGRLGGESMDLWAALMETGRGLDPIRGETERLGYVESMLRARASLIAEKLDGRMEATLDRELEGLGFQAERDRIAAANGGSIFEVEPRRLISARRPLADAARREVAASVVVRDALRTLLDESSAYVMELYPDADLPDAYREASLRRGFPNEMRRRWSERAIDAALQLDDLDDETREALLAVEEVNGIELAALRADAIARCIARDPKLARDFIDAEFDGEDQKVDWEPEMWLGINYEQFAAVDDRTERQLRAILAPGQIERLPALRQRAERREKDGRAK
jgi:hypothetical protein